MTFKFLKLIASIIFAVSMGASLAQAQTITASNVQIEWKVVNRFRLFSKAETFKAHEDAWRQYLIHVDQLNLSPEVRERLVSTTSVLGSEHVLNDRYIAFSRHLRMKYDPLGWAAKQIGDVCWDAKQREHAACGGVENYVVPKSHVIQLLLKPLEKNLLFAEYNCEWRIGEAAPITAPCDEPLTATLPYPSGATITVKAVGETGISTDIKVRDLLIAGLGDSFASGEGNPDVPVRFSDQRRYKNLYPRRERNDGSGNAQWMDEPCHRSLYGHQLRAALQIAVENPQTSVTFMGYACSGAAVDEGLLGPQSYVDYVSDGSAARPVNGKRKDTQLRWLLRELCKDKPKLVDDIWTCPGGAYRRNVDYLLLSIGGNDIGFSNLVAWSTLRDNTSSILAKFFGATVSPKTFASNMKDILPGVYGRLAKALETSVPLRSGELAFDASRVILTAYPDILEDETGKVCQAGNEGDDEDKYAANQSLDLFQSWLVVTPGKLDAAHQQLEKLHTRMGELAEDHGWSFAARAYADKAFRGHGFCAQSRDNKADPAEQLIMPCWGKAERDTLTCETNWAGKNRDWRPYNPATQNYPYALRQRWVRSFNDAFLAMNTKVLTKDGQIDEAASESVFAETTGAMHPNAEGHAAMADAILIDLRARLIESAE